MDDIEIRPGWGITHLAFGATVDEAGAVLGPPARTVTEDDDDDLVSLVWTWDRPPLELRFEEEVGFRLTSLITASPDATLFGHRIIGTPTASALDFLAKYGILEPIGAPVQDGLALVFEDRGIILWTRDERVHAVQWGVKMDDEGEFCWPVAAEA